MTRCDRWRETVGQRGRRDYVRVIRDRPFVFLLGTAGSASLSWYAARRLAPPAWKLDDPTLLVDFGLLIAGAMIFAALLGIAQFASAPIRQLHEIRQAFYQQVALGTDLWDPSTITIEYVLEGPEVYVAVQNNGATAYFVAELLSLRGLEDVPAPTGPISWHREQSPRLRLPTKVIRRLHLASVGSSGRVALHLTDGDQIHYLPYEHDEQPVELTAVLSIRPDVDGIAVAAQFESSFHIRSGETS